MEIVRVIENSMTDKKDRPFAKIEIANCGELIPLKKAKNEVEIKG